MGKLEKVVVLSVLFVIAVILVVSLTMDNPIDKQHVSVLGGGTKPAPETQLAPQPQANVAAPVATGTPPLNTATPSALLSANVETGGIATPPPGNVPAAQPTTALLDQPAPSTPLAPAVPAGSILVTTNGLAESFVADMKFYTWKPGDTYRGVAQTYYGDWEKLSILRRANEGRRNVQPGEKILVPVFDPDAAAAPTVANAGTPAKSPANAPVNAGAKKDAAKKSSKSATPDKAPSGGGRIHVVKEGESLWKIAKAELGNGALWEKIYAANRDVMKSPEALKTGMKLRIP